jgi:anti-sigma regulatory factor (Ser/Thr protein kinase)
MNQTPTLIAIPAEADAPQRARAVVRALIGSAHPRVEEVLLATSELVSNAVQHGDLGTDERILVEISQVDQHVRVTVSHPGLPVEMTQGRTADPGGFGFRIVATVSDDWQVTHDGDSVHAWFEIEPSGRDYP